MDKWQFMNLDSIKIDLNGVNVNTRPVINTFIQQWFSVHGGEMWSSYNLMALVQDIEILCKGLGYRLKLEREGDNMRVIVYAV